MSVARRATRRRWYGYLTAIVIGLLFGGTCQYLGTLSPAGAAVSNLFAPWLLLAFVLGAAQATQDAAAGAVGLLAAAIAYTAMIMSPTEGVHGLALAGIARIVWSQAHWLAAALIFGPLYGYLGRGWRASGSRLRAAFAVAALVAEALLRLTGPLHGDAAVSYAELAVAAALAGYFVLAARRRARLAGGRDTSGLP